MENLNKLFEEAKKEGGVEAGFKRLAEYLMNECVLEVNSEKYQLAEIEFYYFNKEEHKDFFTHCSKEQLKSNTFYFHGSGMDITFGNKYYCAGILIRSIINKKTLKLESGPKNVVNKILHSANTSNGELTLNLKLLHISKKDNNILTSCRVGININESNNCKDLCNEVSKVEIKNEKIKFIFKPYRYILNNEELILKLLKSTDSHFLAKFLEKYKFNDKISKKIKEKINYLTNEEFLKSSKEKRHLFIKKFVEK